MRIVTAVLLVLTAASGVPAQEESGEGRSLDPNQVVATVDDHMILLREVLKRIGPALGDREPRDQIRLIDTQVLQLVRRELKKKGARELQLVVGEKQVDEEVAHRRERLKGRGLDLDEVLAEQGMSMEEFREQLREEVLIYTFERAVAGLLPPNLGRQHAKLRPRHDSFVRPKELQDFYKAHQDDFRLEARARVRTIFIGAVDFLEVGMEIRDARRKARVLGRELLERIEAGEDFAALAREYSRDTFREQGGDHGLQTKEELPELLRDFAFERKPGSTSELIETRSGYLIARLEERQDARVRPFEEVQEDIRKLLVVARREQSVARATLDLLDETDVTPQRYAFLMRQTLLDEIERR